MGIVKVTNSMDYQSVITNLREKIFRELIPIVNGNYYHLDNPYHNNIGDNLIWEGEKQFLKHVPYKNLGNSSSASWRWPEIKNGDVILLHGGGNFGDLYRGAQDFRLEVIKRYSDNRIVMFPQSVWYDDMSLVEKDAEIMYRHKDLTLCLRDLPSYEFMKAHFPKCRLLLMPDMAFCILDSFLQRFRGKENGKELFLRRLDKELLDTHTEIPESMEVRDWPTVESYDLSVRVVNGLIKLGNISNKIPMASSALMKTGDLIADTIMRPTLVKKGCRFLAPYSRIITTRLHVLILSVLLHKPVEYIDNCSGKLSAYADTWLTNLESVKKFI